MRNSWNSHTLLVGVVNWYSLGKKSTIVPTKAKHMYLMMKQFTSGCKPK